MTSAYREVNIRSDIVLLCQIYRPYLITHGRPEVQAVLPVIIKQSVDIIS